MSGVTPVADPTSPVSNAIVMEEGPLSTSKAPKGLLYWREAFDIRVFDPTGHVKSHCLSTQYVFYIRLFMLFYAITVFILAGVETRDAYLFFAYFTDLSYLGIILYLAALLESASDPWRLAFWILYECLPTFHLVVPIVFWALLSGTLIHTGQSVTWYASVSQHALDFVFVYVEVCFLNTARMSFKWTHLASIIFIVFLYLFWAWIYHAASNFWVYSFLNYNVGLNAAYYVGVFVLFIGAFYLAGSIHMWRDRFFASRSINRS